MASPITRHSCLAVIAVLLLGMAGSAHADAVEPPATEPAAATEPAPATEPASTAPAPDVKPAVEPAPAPYAKNYVTVLAGTTFFYRPDGGPASGWQRDVTPGVGYGRLVTPKIAIELDLVPAFVKGEYSAFYLVPGVVWNFSTYVYAAARFLVKVDAAVDPKFDIGVFPGIGGFYGLSNGLGFSLELNVGSNYVEGNPDLSAFLTAGVLYAF